MIKVEPVSPNELVESIKSALDRTLLICPPNKYWTYSPDPESIVYGKLYVGLMPYSEVMIHMGKAGKIQMFVVKNQRSVELINPDGSTGPCVTWGEAGIMFGIHQGPYYYPPSVKEKA